MPRALSFESWLYIRTPDRTKRSNYSSAPPSVVEFLFLSQRAQRGTIGGSIALKTSRDFAEAHRTIYVYTRDKEIELEVFAVDVVDANSEGKRTDFADAAELDAYLGDKLSQTSNSRTVVFVTYSADN